MLAGVVVAVLAIMLIVHVLAALLRMALSLDLVVFVHAVCLCQLIDFTSHEASEKLFGKSMIDLFTCCGKYWYMRV